MTLFIGMPERDASSGKLFNSVAVVDRNGTIQGTYRKIKVIPGSIEGWSSPGEATPVFVLDGIRVGILICADAYRPEIAARYAQSGATLLLSSASWSPEPMGPGGCWEDRSREIDLPLLVCNRGGREPGWSFLGSESVVDHHGQRLFTFKSPTTRIFMVDLNRATGTFTLMDSVEIVPTVEHMTMREKGAPIKGSVSREHTTPVTDYVLFCPPEKWGSNLCLNNVLF